MRIKQIKFPSFQEFQKNYTIHHGQFYKIIENEHKDLVFTIFDKLFIYEYNQQNYQKGCKEVQKFFEEYVTKNFIE